jgi:hypothetical protein
VNTSAQVCELSWQQPGHSQPSVRKLAKCIKPQVWLDPLFAYPIPKKLLKTNSMTTAVIP